MLIVEANITGESLPVDKKIGDEGYSGSIAKKGEMNAVAIGTGNNTFFGRTAKLVASAGRIDRLDHRVHQRPARPGPEKKLWTDQVRLARTGRPKI